MSLDEAGDWTLTSALDESERVAVSEAVLGWLGPGDDCALENVARWTPDHWAAARRAIEIHGVGPLLDVALGSRPERQTPAALRAFVSHTAMLNRTRAVLWRSELDRLIGASAAAGIAVVALKSAAIVLHGLDRAEWRPTADIDVLVPADALDRAERVWESLGYEHEGRSARHRLYFLRRLGASGRHGLGEHPDNPLRLDVHTTLRKPMPIASVDATDAVWSVARPSVQNESARVPDAAALLQHLVVHASNDLLFAAARWLSLRDLVLVASRCDATDWTTLMNAATKHHAEPGFYAAFRMTERYVGGAAPPDVMTALEARTPAALRDHLDRTPLSLMSYVADRRGLAAVGRMLRWAAPGWERLRCARRILLPSPSEWAGRLGPEATRGRFWYVGRMGQSVRSVFGAPGRRAP